MAAKVPRRSGGLADAAGLAPHFLGHRQRLRQRLLAGGADNLPDYELLEVLLFAGNRAATRSPWPRS
jgi:DNA repair protein RadC